MQQAQDVRRTADRPRAPSCIVAAQIEGAESRPCIETGLQTVPTRGRWRRAQVLCPAVCQAVQLHLLLQAAAAARVPLLVLVLLHVFVFQLSRRLLAVLLVPDCSRLVARAHHRGAPLAVHRVWCL